MGIGNSCTKNQDKTSNNIRSKTIQTHCSNTLHKRPVRELQRIYQKYGITTIHKPRNTIRDFLVHPKDKTPTIKKCGVLYKIPCNNCNEFDVGETARPLEKRLQEHHRTRGEPNTITGMDAHIVSTGHTFLDTDVSVLAREEHWLRRKILESIHIRTSKPGLNKDQGYELPPIYQTVLTRDSPSGESRDLRD